jgi:uncharacterized protein involved in type VI secretion and phage assembly
MGQSASHGQMRIVSISHQLSGDGHYSNTFEAIPAGAGTPSLSYYQPATHPMLAKVIDNKDPHGMGRIKAEFIGWGGEGKQTDWLRVLTPDAGGGGEKVAKNRGLVTIPELGDQVYVDWEGGNPDRPFVTGSVFHGKHGGGGGTGNNSKSLTSKSGHTVHLDDGAGITIRDKNKNTVHIDGSGNITATSSDTNSADVGKGKSVMKMDKEGNIAFNAAKAITLTTGQSSITMQEDGTIIVKGKLVGIGATEAIGIGATNAIDISSKNNHIGGITKMDGGDVFIN